MLTNSIGGIGPINAFLVPVTESSEHSTVLVASQAFTTDLTTGTGKWLFTASTDCYIKQAAVPVASAGDGSMLVPAGVPVLLDGAQGVALAVIRDGSDGFATIQEMGLLT